MSGNISSQIEFYGVFYPNDYTHVRHFDSLSEQSAYFDNLDKGYVATDQKYIRQGVTEFTIRLKGKIQGASSFSYARIRNTHDSVKYYYCFVDYVTYIDDLTVEFHLSLDVYQTYCFSIQLLKSQVERQHEPLYTDSGLPYPNTLDEGLNYGTEYDVVSSRNVMDTKLFYLVIKSTKYLGKVYKEEDLQKINRFTGTPQSLYTYVLPFTLEKQIELIEGGQDNFYVFPFLSKFLIALGSDKGTVNSIVSIYITLHAGFNMEKDLQADVGINKNYQYDVGNLPQGIVKDLIQTGDLETPVLMFTNYKVATDPIYTLQNKYLNVPPYRETKLFMYPYTIIELTDFKGNQIILRPEYIQGNDIQVMVRGSAGNSNKVAYEIKNYLNLFDQGSYDFALIDDTPNNLPILTDATADYMQGNQNSLNTQRKLAASNMKVGIADATINAAPNLMLGWFGLANAGSGFASGVLNSVNQNFNTTQTLNAKIKDINNVPPSVASMGGNIEYEFMQQILYPVIRIKTLKPEYAQKLQDYFHQYGYLKNELVYPAIHTRKNWNFVKCASVNVQSPFNQEITNRFKQIFLNGVTLWHNDDIMNYDKTNEVI